MSLLLALLDNDKTVFTPLLTFFFLSLASLKSNLSFFRSSGRRVKTERESWCNMGMEPEKKTVERFFSFLICSTQSSPSQHSNFFLIDFMGRWSLGYLCCISEIEKSFKGEIAWSMGIFGERISVIDEVELDS